MGNKFIKNAYIRKDKRIDSRLTSMGKRANEK